MNKKEQRILENKIRRLQEQPYEPSEERIEELKTRAFQEYMRRMSNENPVPAPAPEKKKGILRRVVVVSAVAVCLMVLPIVYTVLAPVTVSKANDLAYKVAIWLNDNLHTRIAFYEPVDDEAIPEDLPNTSFSSLQEAAQALSMPIVYFDHPDIHFVSLDTYNSEIFNDPANHIIICYEYKGFPLSITVTQSGSNSIVTLKEANTTTIATTLGEAIIWKVGEKTRCIMFYERYTLQFYCNIDNDTLVDLLDTIKIIN